MTVGMGSVGLDQHTAVLTVDMADVDKTGAMQAVLEPLIEGRFEAVMQASSSVVFRPSGISRFGASQHAAGFAPVASRNLAMHCSLAEPSDLHV